MKVAICSSAYPVPDAFLTDYIKGIVAATTGVKDVMVVIAAEAGFDASLIKSRLPESLSIGIDQEGPVKKPLALRRRMLKQAMSTDADVFIFTDFDDRITAGAVPAHLEALEEFDISFGDMIPIDNSSREYGRTFFEDVDVPKTVTSVEAILDRNFMGFSNTAVKRTAVTKEAQAIPDGTSAADWWFYSMLLMNGARAKQAASPVGYYRNYENSLLGTEGAKSLVALRKRAEIAEAHYRHLPNCAGARDRNAKVRRLIDTIDEDAASVEEILPLITQEHGVWLDDVRCAVALNETNY